MKCKNSRVRCCLALGQDRAVNPAVVMPLLAPLEQHYRGPRYVYVAPILLLLVFLEELIRVTAASIMRRYSRIANKSWWIGDILLNGVVVIGVDHDSIVVVGTK
jgi:hypothetical protein